jgi:transcription antitermination factor NusG
MNMSSRLERNTVTETAESQWFAIQTTAKHEKSVTKQLKEKDVDAFLPLLPEIHRWSDRKKKVEVPVFGCYTFVRIMPMPENRLPVLTTPGVLGFVGSTKAGTPIPDNEIENLKTAIKAHVWCRAHPFISVGTRVRIRGGPLAGVEGILTSQGDDQCVVISVQLLQRSVSIKIEEYEIVPI